MDLDLELAIASVDRIWDESALPALVDYIRIPAKSPAFDADWAAHGHLAEAVDLVAGWSRSRDLPGATVEVIELAGRTPVVLVEVPAHGAGDPNDTVLFYGHLDKQPELTGWREGLGPWTPVLEGDRLYGRGGADDGYSAFAALSALEAVRAAGGSHSRCLVLIEASEESGSLDLPAHVAALGDRLGAVSLVICLDSFAGDYETLWVTTSLRGLVGLDVRVRVLEEGVHSGVAGGAVPSSFRVLRQLLDRIEDCETGDLLVPELYVEIPEERRREAQAAVAAGLDPLAGLPFAGRTRPEGEDPVELLLATTWLPSMAVVGIEGAPPLDDAGNVLRAETAVKLSFRLPPTADADTAVGRAPDPPHRGPALGRRDRDQRGRVGHGLGRGPDRPLVGRRPRRLDQGHVRAPGALHRCGGCHPLHEHARGALPGRPVRGDRCARAGLQRARPQRVPPRPHRPPPRRLHGPHSRRPHPAAPRLTWPPSATVTRCRHSMSSGRRHDPRPVAERGRLHVGSRRGLDPRGRVRRLRPGRRSALLRREPHLHRPRPHRLGHRRAG